MQREDKQLELVLENYQSKLNEFKAQINALVFKLEHERDNVSWATVLDTFAVFSTQYTAIMKYLSYEKLPQLRNYSVLPLMLNPERDEELARITENRVPALSHDIVPDFLRTKTEPEVEHKLMQVEHKASGLQFETAQKQQAAFNKVVNHVLDLVSKAREEWEVETGARVGIGQTSSVADLHTLVSAVSMGKNLKPMVPQVSPGGMMVPPTGRPVTPGLGPNTPPMGMMPKPPPGMKTNTKTAGAPHPYGR